ncbi:hypothetical protein [Pontibacter chinhatensis]|uniref:Uncharacterized protein n=1 Tax=Pontibacter chinhatensis TaxID=1436961 RepID=A0A1I2QLM2_9BACT|nr:hypothetical protein [Pontibacter chinhatensis]SFG29342.1 hypothetical protein SAMN05421739_10251 [Pontibacter chinhatensis]
MLQNLITLGIITLYALLVAYLLNAFINLQLRKFMKSNEVNLSLALVKLTFLVAGGLLLSEIPAVINTLSDTLRNQYAYVELYKLTFQNVSFFIGIILLVLIFIYFVSTALFRLVSPKNSFKIEVANNVVERVIIFIGIVLIITFSIKGYIPILLDYFIPYQTIPTIR